MALLDDLDAISTSLVAYDFSDAGTVTLSGSSITAVADLTATNYDLTQGTAGRRPTNLGSTPNGKVAAVFDGGDDLRKTGTSLVSDTTLTAWCVFSCTSGGSSDYGRVVSLGYGTAFDYDNVAAAMVIGYWNLTGPLAERNGVQLADRTGIYNQWVVVVSRFNGSTCQMWVNGVSASEASTGTFGVTSLFLGAMAEGGSDGMIGSIAGAGLFDAALTDTECSVDLTGLLTEYFIGPAYHTATGAKQLAGTTTVSIASPAATASGQMLLAGRVAWETGISFTNETDWTNTASLAGGTGTAADNHTTAVRVDRRELSGSLAGPTVFDQTGALGVIGIMLSYSKADSGATWDVASATGDGATHAANRSVAASSSIGFAPGDVLVAFAAVDTDAALTISAQSLTASGITFGATTRRTSGVGSGTGDDGNIEVFEAAVTAGTATVAPTLAFTTATSQCGPVAFVRLRAAVAGGATATPAVIALAATIPAATVPTSATATPAVIARSMTLPTSTGSGGGTSTPTAIARAATLPAVTLSAGGSSSPAVIARPFALPAATASGTTAGTATPAVIAATVTIPAASASGATAGTATPTVITTTITLPAPTPSGGGQRTPAVIPLTVTIPAASASGATTGTATPAVIARAVTVPAPTNLAGSTAAPAVMSLAVTLPVGAASGSKTVTAPIIARTVSLPSPGTTGGSAGNVTPAAIGVVSILPAPALRYGSTKTPATISLLVVIPPVVPPFTIGRATSTLIHADAASELVAADATSTLEYAAAATTSILLEN